MLEIVSLEAAHADAGRELLRGYPHRAFQQRRQGLDPDRLAGMLWDGLARSVGEPSVDLFAAMDGESLIGLAGLAPNHRHSEAFGMRVARVHPFVVWPRPQEAAPALLDAVLNHAWRRSVEYLSCRIDAGDIEVVHHFENAGFSMIDGSQKLTRRLRGAPVAPAPAPEGFSWGPARDDEIEALAALAVRSHDRNHLYNDPALPDDAVDGLFRDWVRACCGGMARHVFVARRDGAPVGFVDYLGADALQRWLGVSLIVLDFVVVDRAAQGRGVGQWLLSETLGRLADEYDWVELRTSFDNYPALSLYHRLGFETIAADVMLSKRLRDPADDARPTDATERYRKPGT